MGMWTIPKGPEEHLKFSSEELDEFTGELAKLVYERKMSVPAIIALEVSKPLSFVSGSTMTMFAPLLEAIFDPVKYEKFQAVISDRSRIERLISELEALEQQNESKEKEGESRE